MSATVTIGIGEMITSSPGIKRGAPHIAGTGITVRTIARWHQQGLTPEEIVIKYTHLSLAQIHAALAFYFANRQTIDADLTQQDEETKEIEAEVYGTRRQ
jgi:uncharacterized protein (DUF433 family)